MLHRKRYVGFAEIAFWVCLASALTLALLPPPPHFREFGDKAQHMLAFGTLAFLGTFAFPAFPKTRLAERLSFLGALVEVLQSIPSLHRDCDIQDWIADTIAIVAVLALLHAMNLPRRARQAERRFP
ncbi:hypothetical protein [Novosphingobium sp. NDB2Meth1]|uniref:hypothetical protein n=1 Tax=Novosphingobium sp. NDB2Meth1 TaxID=1892847 RepID=UPI00093092B9|nr:hypothetical protein [Novosphingobium sp. NDB2Meth1]